MRRSIGRPPPDEISASRDTLLGHMAVLAIFVAVIWLQEAHTKPKAVEPATPLTSVAAMSR